MVSRSRVALVVLVVVLAVIVLAVPAQASSVKSGSSQLTISHVYTTELLAKQITMAPVSPATMKTLWNSLGMYWWFRVPMVARSGANASNYVPSTGKGTFYHSGSMRFVEGAVTPHKIFRAEGIRMIALSKTSYQMSVSYKTTAGPYVRVILAQSNANKPKITHKGKAYKIDGVQFVLTQAGHDAILATIGESLDMTKVIFSTDLLPVLK